MTLLVLSHLRAIYIRGGDELRAEFDADEAAGYNLDATGWLPMGGTAAGTLAGGFGYSHARRPHDFKPSDVARSQPQGTER